MRPVPIPTEMLRPGTERKTVMSHRHPDDPMFMTIEAMIEWIDSTPEEDLPPYPEISVLMQLEDGDLEQLVVNGGKFWYTTSGAPMRPFGMETVEG